MNRVLFIGSFLSENSGSLGPSESLFRTLETENIKIKCVSRKKRKELRLIDIILNCLFDRSERIHIDVFSGQAFKIAEIASLIGILRHKKVFMTFHGGMLPEFYAKFPNKIRQLYKRAYYAQTPSLYLKSFFHSKNIDLKYLPNFIKLERFPFCRNQVKIHSLLWVRAFSSIYNPFLAVKTLYEIRKKYPDTTLTMIGPDKGLLPETKKLISDLGLDSAVWILGPVKNDQLFLYYQTHEVFLNTTSYESFGVALLEAASCGVPIVSTKVGEIPFLYTHGENIMMVEDFEPLDFADKVIRVFESPSIAESLSINARKIAEHFDWDILKAQWVELLSN